MPMAGWAQRRDCNSVVPERGEPTIKMGWEVMQNTLVRPGED
jgi:hypothetical protein